MFLGTARSWGFAKIALGFAKVTQDGDGEGALFMTRLPTEREASAIREKLGVPKKRTVGEAELARLRSLSFSKLTGQRRLPATRAAYDDNALRRHSQSQA
jgi:hypothetical protein